MMIGGGIQEVKAVEIAQSAGYKVIVTDRKEDAPCFSYADYTVTIDGRDIEGLIAYTLLKKEKLNITGIFTLTELVTSVAAVASACDLPGISIQSAVACQNKQVCKEIWIKNNIPTPKGKIIKTTEEAKLFFDVLNDNAFIKPLVGFGGIGAYKIISIDDLDKVFIDKKNQELLMEELIEGSMHDVNGVFDSNGEFIPLGCFDRFFDHDAPIELRAVYPSQLNDKLVKEAYKLTKNAALSLGISWGPVKSDLVLTENGFQILEMAPRLHGPKGTLWLSALSGGSNHFKSILPIISNFQHTIKIFLQPKFISAYQIINSPDNKFSKIEGTEKIEKDGFELMIFKTYSDYQLLYQNNSDVVGYIFGYGKSLDELDMRMNAALNSIVFK